MAAEEQVETTQESQEAKQFKPIETQEALDKLITERVSRERKKYADYEALKEKAAKLDEIEQANKSELEKAQEKITQLEQAAEDAKKAKELADIRAEVAKETGIPETLIKGSTKEEMAEFAQSVAQFAKAQKPAAPVINEAGKYVVGDMPMDPKRKMLKDLIKDN